MDSELLRDAEGLPYPQYVNETETDFEALKGKDGAQFVRVKNGHDEAVGSTTDAEAVAGNGTTIAILKALRTRLANLEARIGNNTASPGANTVMDRLDRVTTALQTVVTNQSTITDVLAGGLPETLDQGRLQVAVQKALPAGNNKIGTVEVTNLPVTQNVNVDNFPAKQNVSVDNFPLNQDVTVGNLPEIQKVEITNHPASEAPWKTIRVAFEATETVLEGNVVVKASKGEVTKLVVEGTATVTLLDGETQAWLPGNFDASGIPVEFATSINVHFNGTGAAWILYR